MNEDEFESWFAPKLPEVTRRSRRGDRWIALWLFLGALFWLALWLVLR